MGEFQFFYPANELDSALAKRVFVTKRMRYPVESHARVKDLDGSRRVLTVRTATPESGALYIPHVARDGSFFFVSTETLPCDGNRFSLFLELARGQLSRILRKQSDWTSVGFRPSSGMRSSIRKAVRRFAELATLDYGAPEFDARSVATFRMLTDLSLRLNEQFLSNVLDARRKLVNPWTTRFGFTVDLNSPWEETYDQAFLPQNGRRRSKIDPVFQTFNPEFGWREIEREPGVYDWSLLDAALESAEKRGLQITMGPLLRWGSKPPAFVDRLNAKEIVDRFRKYVDALVTHVGPRANRWIVATNVESKLDVPPIETRLVVAAKTAFQIRAMRPKAEIFLGFELPFGDPGRRGALEMSGYDLATRVARRNVFDGFYLEVNFGETTISSAPPDPMEMHRFFDRWSSLGVPLCIGTSCPSAPTTQYAVQDAATQQLDAITTAKAAANPEFLRQWAERQYAEGGLLSSSPEEESFENSVWTERNQRETARRFFATALSRRCVEEIIWTRWQDKPYRYANEPSTHLTDTDDGERDTEVEEEKEKNSTLTCLGEFDSRDPDRFPTSGIFDENQNPKATLHKLAAMRRAYID